MKPTHLEVNGNNGSGINMETIQVSSTDLDYKDLITSVFGNDISANELLEKMKHSKPMPIKQDSIIINATPYIIQEIISGLTYNPSIKIKVSDEYIKIGVIDQKVPLFNRVLGDVKGLPKFKYGTYYIVPKMVKEAVTEREDLISVGNVKSKSDTTINCEGFVR